ncbi:tyrosine-protein phosphatase 10D isoform X3 [Athalia rosae]|uniref:tyrosine-protein phosphatase 10D isoform X3 n=1 Tax=Athalia rosae TaxID=37344 RepID=UPI0020345B80|nr:tyrosine-protein phosphatase 10D isoform X3 [Athalia rosae]
MERPTKMISRWSGIILILLAEVTYSTDLAIEIPGNLSQGDSWYRLDYSPPIGHPPPRTELLSADIGAEIKLTNVLAGTRYEFNLYYSNATFNELLTWTASITTAPDPPSNLTVIVPNGKTATVSWSPPAEGNYSGFRLRVQSFTDTSSPRTIVVAANDSSYTLRDLIPGASYSLQLFTVLDANESVAYTSTNFTTKPNTPGKFIVWFRNETTLLVLWQPPYPAGIYTHYKVSIDPPDAIESVLYVEKEGEPPGPAQAAFKGLVPGRAYNISVQTVSEDETSAPTTAQYRTVPLRPLNVTFDRRSLTPTSFRVFWEPPNGTSEFDKYQVSLASRRLAPVTRIRDDERSLDFRDLEPGKTYQVIVKTVSGKVTSWPATGDITLEPLPVKNLRAVTDEKSGKVEVSWSPDNSSTQDSYKLFYVEVDKLTADDSTLFIVDKPRETLHTLLPGRNYSISVQAISNKAESKESVIYQVTKPASPIIEDFKPIEKGLIISWKSDVNSRQEQFEVIYNRTDTGERVTTTTIHSHIDLEDLYPGAFYEVKVVAINHGLRSEPHVGSQAVLPHPPKNLSIEKVEINKTFSLLVKWEPPTDSMFTEFAIRYQTDDDTNWHKFASVNNTTEAEIHDMTHGERYTIRVNTVSFGVESLESLQVNQTIEPKSVTNITATSDSTNVTLVWQRPDSRIETYVIKWWPVENIDDVRMKNVTEIHVSAPSDSKESVQYRKELIGDLMPGVEYAFSIFTVSYNLVSDVTNLTTRTMPLIESSVVVVVNIESPYSLTLTYTPTPVLSSSRFDLYRFSISDLNNTVKEKMVNDTDYKVTFTGLTPGKLYNVTAWTVSDNVESSPLIKQDRLYPDPVTNMHAVNITDTTIQLTWDAPRGEYDYFEVQYWNTDESMEGSLVENITNRTFITLNDLRPYRNYTFTVVVISGSGSPFLRKSHPVSNSFITSESYPGKVDTFQPTNITPSEITFSWSLPSREHNGVIVNYTITYGLEGSVHTKTQEFKANELRGTIRSLNPGMTYLFRIQAATMSGFGPEMTWTQKMPILPPPRPPTQVVPSEVCKSSTTIQVRFRKNYFSEQNGAVISYTIIVAEDDSKNASGLEMPSWKDVQGYSIWPPYQVMEPYNPFKNGAVEDFTIGGEKCDLKVGYCNGPLKSGSTYKVKVRAFTAPDKFTDTSYSFPIQTGLGLLIRRRRSQGRKTTETRATDDLSLPGSVIEISRPIRVESFADHYRMMSADSDFRFSEEFEELKHVGRDQPCTAADLPCNRPKNRFTNILPYDHSRFKLQPVDDEEGSDYINANYVPGHNSPREFIVTQGPLHSTRDDFWRMVWESNSRAIVMLTRCIEKGREKCDHYWPTDTLPVYYGDICVTILNEAHYPDWSITEFMLCRGDVKRVIQHFHFTTWPDFGVPSPPQTLARFVRAFRERVRPDQRPIVVHCSAGVGRSGTFITLDRILQQILVSDYVDIFGIVCAMRKERVWMVQTEQQYICIHQCLLAVLEGQDTTGPIREIHDNQGFEDIRSAADGSVASSVSLDVPFADREPRADKLDISLDPRDGFGEAVRLVTF